MKGPVAGTKKHAEAAKTIRDKIKENPELEGRIRVEERYFEKRELRLGSGVKSGFKKPDVYDTETNTVYDFKFGGAQMKESQIKGYQDHVKTGVDIKVVKPE